MKGLIIALISLVIGTASADAEYGWIMCQPDSEVNIRSGPSKRSEVVAHGYVGDRVELDGKRKGQWVHCIIPCEYGEGWIREDFISFDPPEDLGSGICETTNDNVWARYSAGGKRRKRLKKGSVVTLYFTAAGWSVTSEGFIATRFLEEIPAEKGDDPGG